MRSDMSEIWNIAMDAGPDDGYHYLPSLLSGS